MVHAVVVVNSLVLYLQSFVSDLKTVHLLNGRLGSNHRVIGHETCYNTRKRF